MITIFQLRDDGQANRDQALSDRAATSELADILGLPAFDGGWVWLAGAGPGDPGLITVLGAHAIGHADVILYDALANEALFKLARPGAELLFAGKRKGMKASKQDEISASLVSLAKQNKRVLRLKGGDPYMFGRGGEEALALSKAGIPFFSYCVFYFAGCGYTKLPAPCQNKPAKDNREHQAGRKLKNKTANRRRFP